MTILLLPVNDEKIVTVSSDGTNIAFGLLMSAKTVVTISIISTLMAGLLYTLYYLFWMHRPEINILPHCNRIFQVLTLTGFVTK